MHLKWTTSLLPKSKTQSNTRFYITNKPWQNHFLCEHLDITFKTAQIHSFSTTNVFSKEINKTKGIIFFIFSQGYIGHFRKDNYSKVRFNIRRTDHEIKWDHGDQQCNDLNSCPQYDIFQKPQRLILKFCLLQMSVLGTVFINNFWFLKLPKFRSVT